MIAKSRYLMAIAAAFFCRLAVALSICGACGHELAEGQRFCGHCGAKGVAGEPAAVAESVEAVAVVEPGEPATYNAALFLEAAREDSRTAAELEEKQPEVALFYYRNAAALARLIPEEMMPATASQKLIESVERCQRRMSQTLKACEVCTGTGKRTMVMRSLSGESDGTTMRAEGMVCSACNGAGVVRSHRNAEELRLLLAQGGRSHELRQQTARRVAIGNAWVPAVEAEKLRPRQQALLRTAMAAPCNSCQGQGVQVCRGCKGQGRVKCRERGCVNGMVERKQSNTLSPSTALNLRVVCPSCKGNSWIMCGDCGGTGSVACRTCDGIGRPAKCRKCGGAGTASCTVCRGAGRDRSGKNCTVCMGEGVGLCPTCHGEGCVSR
ncbi:MAG: hypothetical protein GX230_08955 [Lentisphaerae bacterium]|jgi:hypothetical protein|nr:hypothetical protein [Lentisphaerota bacterium]